MKKKLSRKKRYMQCLLWRSFISDLRSANFEEYAKRCIVSLSCVIKVEIHRGWTNWVTVILDDGEEFCERKFWVVDSLKLIGEQIYKKYVGEYLDYIKKTKADH